MVANCRVVVAVNGGGGGGFTKLQTVLWREERVRVTQGKPLSSNGTLGLERGNGVEVKNENLLFSIFAQIYAKITFEFS
jgi:hypothetical protein